MCFCVSISGGMKAEKCMSVYMTDLWVCRMCVCFFVTVCSRFSVSVSDRCVGSGLSCWHWGLALLSLVGRIDRLRSRSAGTAPNHGCLSCGGAYTPGPPSAQAYRCETRSVWHSTDPQSSLQISDNYPLPGLEKYDQKREVKICCIKDTLQKLLVVLLNGTWSSLNNLDSPFVEIGWLLWAVEGFLAWCSMVLLCLCQPVTMDASAPSMSFAWQTPIIVKRRKRI